MKLEKCDSLKVADKVLAELRKMPSVASRGLQPYVDTYSNCREQGYTVHACHKSMNIYTDKTVMFSQNRNSDVIVVYPMTGYETHLTDAGYAAAKYFEPGDYKGAAKFAYQSLKN